MRKNLLIFAVLVTAVALVAGSFALPAMAAESGASVTETAEQTGVSVVSEDVSLRGEYEKHYLMSDGSYQAVVYSEPVHELVDGAWVEITSTNQNARDSATTDNTKSNIIDNYVLQGGGVQNKSLDRLYIGNRSAGLTRAYIQFATMPTIPEGSTITSATMTLHLTSGTSTAANASAYMVTGGEWTSGTIQWSNMPTANALLQGDISHNNVTGYTFSCLSAVQTWYNGDPTGQHNNYGIMLKYANESIDDYNAVYSADCTDANKRPSLSIIYYTTPSEIDILEGYTRQLSVSGATGTITWASDNTAIATVDSNGVVTGIKAGMATITASVGDIVYDAFTVYVKLPDGVYRIENANTEWYLGTNYGIEEHTQVKILPVATNGIGQARQLWAVKYLDSGLYSVRPMCKSDMALHQENGFVDITTVGNVDSIIALPNANLWKIELGVDGYLFKCGGQSTQTMWVSSVFPYASVKTGKYASTNANFRWSMTKVAAVTNEVLLIDTKTGESAANVTRYISPGATATLAELNITACFMCTNSTDQRIVWSTLNPSVVSVNAETGAVTALTAGAMATIVAKYIYNGLEYNNYYTIQVQKRDAPVFCIKHYYDIGYGIREGNAMEKIQVYHATVEARFESVFDIEMYPYFYTFTSICDDCKIDQFGSVAYTNLDSFCNHSTSCTQRDQLRNDIIAQGVEGNEIMSIVLWTGHRMCNDQEDRSSSRSDLHSVVITRRDTAPWNEDTECYEEETDEVKFIKESFTLLHELSHQLGAPDHYCRGASASEGCSNSYCDTCYFGYNSPRACVMSREYDLSLLSDEELYCMDCEAVIESHLADHH